MFQALFQTWANSISISLLSGSSPWFSSTIIQLLVCLLPHWVRNDMWLIKHNGRYYDNLNREKWWEVWSEHNVWWLLIFKNASLNCPNIFNDLSWFFQFKENSKFWKKQKFVKCLTVEIFLLFKKKQITIVFIWPKNKLHRNAGCL